MDKHLVLIKFFEVQRKLNQEKKAKEMQRLSEKIKEISPNGREVLRILLENDSVNQRTLAKFIDVSSQAISENLKRLEQLGYINKVNGNQNNENIINLTQSGKEIAEDLDKRIRKHSKEVMKKLSDDEVEQLYNILKKILD